MASKIARLRTFLEQADIPGLVAVVARGDAAEVIATGEAKADTIFRISSMTKPITAAAAMLLVEECVLRLDDPVDALLPELANRRVLVRADGPLDDTVPATRAITVRDLLTFQSGYGLVMSSPERVPYLRALADSGIHQGPPHPDRMPAADAFLKGLAPVPLLHQPGAKWTYHWHADLLGVLVARASGASLGDFLRARIFEPLGMKDTGFWVPEASRARLGTHYTPEGGTLSVYDTPNGEWSHAPTFESGAAGLVSTASDLLAFSRMMLGGGRTRVLSRASIELMTTNHLTDAQRAISGLFAGDFDHLGFGFGMSITLDRHDLAYSVGTFGWAGGLGSTWYMDPARDVTTIFLTPVAWMDPHGPQLAKDFATLAYASLED